MQSFKTPSVTLLLLALLALQACSKPKEQTPDAPASFRVDDNGVQVKMALEGWKLDSVSEDPRVHKFTKNGIALYLQMRKFRFTETKTPTDLELRTALVDFCAVSPCNTLPLKPGYWANHFETVDTGVRVVNWDIGTVSKTGDLLMLIIKLKPETPAAHKEIEKALESSLVLSRK